MAPKNPNSALFLIALILFASSNPLAYAQSLFGGSSITGNLCCTPTGTCPGPPISGATITYNCLNLLGGNVLVGQNTTGTNGFFNITAPNITNQIPTILSPFPCMVSAQLPLNQTICPILSTLNGTLTGVVGTISPLLTRLFGVVQAVRIVGFVNVTAP